MNVSMRKKRVRTKSISKVAKPPKPPKPTRSRNSSTKRITDIMRRMRIDKHKVSSSESESESENESKSESSSSGESDSSDDSISDSSGSSGSSGSSSSEESESEENFVKCRNPNCDAGFCGIVKTSRRKCKHCGLTQTILPNFEQVKKASFKKPKPKQLKRKSSDLDIKVEEVIEEVIEKTKKLAIVQPVEIKTNEIKITKTTKTTNPKPAKRIKLIKDDTREEWPNPIEEFPVITHPFKIVDGITTKFITVVSFEISGKPAYCKNWNDHFINGIKPDKTKFTKHWDLLPVFFAFINYDDKTYRSKIKVFNDETIVKDTDINVQLNSELTLILRPLAKKSILMLKDLRQETSLRFQYRIITNLRFVTHFSDQVNIYMNKKIIDPQRAWALHLILNEQSMKTDQMSKVQIFFSNHEKIFVYSLTNLYEALYLYFSRQITT